MTGRTALARSYQDVLTGNWWMGTSSSTRTNQALRDRERMMPLIGLMHESSTEPFPSTATQPSGERREQMPLRDLVAAQLSRQRKSYTEEGWEAFKAGEYQKACGKFALAEGYGSVRRSEKLESRLSLLYARIAVGQYSEAIGSLNWMLDACSKGDPEAQRSVEEVQRGFLAAIPELSSRYGKRVDLDNHLKELGTSVAQRENAYRAYRMAQDNPAASKKDEDYLLRAQMEARALQVMMWYAIPEQRSRAMFEARSFAVAPKPWDQLSKILSDNDLGQEKVVEPTVQPVSPAANFPFNIYQEAQTPAAVGRPPVSP